MYKTSRNKILKKKMYVNKIKIILKILNFLQFRLYHKNFPNLISKKARYKIVINLIIPLSFKIIKLNTKKVEISNIIKIKQ